MKRIFLVFILLFTTKAATASTSYVSSPSVEKGKHELSVRAGYSFDNDTTRDNVLKTEVGYEFGVTDYMALEFVVDGKNPGAGDNYEHDSFGAEVKFQFFDKKQDGFDGGVKLEYVVSDNDKGADEAELYTLFRYYFG